jgi:hypothetical protein
MTAEPAFSLHPQAARDITEIWEYIAAFTWFERKLSFTRIGRPSVKTLF